MNNPKNARHLCLATLVLVGACAQGPACAEALRFSLASDPETLYNVQSISGNVDGVLGNYLLERLISIDSAGHAQPWLAESWQISTDQKVVTFKLRSGVKFHDGTPFNAAAAKFHFDTIRDPKSASPLLPLLGPLVAVDAPDERTLRLSFSKPYGPLFNNLALSFFGFNSPTAVQKYGKTYGRKPVGTGPYKLARWTPGTELRLERYADYRQWRRDVVNPGAPRTEAVVLRVIREGSVATAAMEAGELTAAALQPDTITRFEKDPQFRVVIDRNVKSLAFMDMNQHRAPFDDPQFRRAVALSIDRKAVVQGAFSGYATPMTVPLAPGIPGHDKTLAAKAELGWDPAKARALLDKAGWKLNNGVLERAGKPARFVLRGVSGSDVVDRALAIMQSNLKAVGIQVTLETSDWGAFYPGLLKNDWDMAVMAWDWPDGSVMGNLWHAPGHRQHLGPYPELDNTLERCDATVEPKARDACLSQAQHLLIDKTVIVPLWSPWSLSATRAQVHDYTIDGAGYLLPGDVRLAP